MSGPGGDQDSNDAGGMGGNVPIIPSGIKSSRPATRDVRMIERLSRRKDWNISDVAFERLPNEILLVALNKLPDGSPANYGMRERLSAARTIAHMHKQNQDNYPVAQQHDHLHLHADLDQDAVLSGMEQEAARRGLIRGNVVDGETGNGKPHNGKPGNGSQH